MSRMVATLVVLAATVVGLSAAAFSASSSTPVQKLWSQNLNATGVPSDQISIPQVVSANLYIVASGNGTITALNADGAIVWSTPGSTSIIRMEAGKGPQEGLVYILLNTAWTNNTRVVVRVLNALNGDQVVADIRSHLGMSYDGFSVLGEQVLLCGFESITSFTSRCCLYDVPTGKEVLRTELMDEFYSGKMNEHLIVISGFTTTGAAVVRSYSKATGKRVCNVYGILLSEMDVKLAGNVSSAELPDNKNGTVQSAYQYETLYDFGACKALANRTKLYGFYSTLATVGNDAFFFVNNGTTDPYNQQVSSYALQLVNQSTSLPIWQTSLPFYGHGKLVGPQQIPYGISASPSQPGVVVVEWEARLAAVRLNDGKILWQVRDSLLMAPPSTNTGAVSYPLGASDDLLFVPNIMGYSVIRTTAPKGESAIVQTGAGVNTACASLTTTNGTRRVVCVDVNTAAVVGYGLA